MTVDSYQSYIVDYLSAINLFHLDVFCCQKVDCDNSKHKAQIDVLYSHLTNCLVKAIVPNIVLVILIQSQIPRK